MSYREAFGELFEMEGDLLCILTNLQVTRLGRSVMGGGCAERAHALFPGLDRAIGEGVQRQQRFQHLGQFRRQDFGTYQEIAAFPTRVHWAGDADLRLIQESAQHLMRCVETLAFTNVLLPRPGVGTGSLRWDQVKQVLAPIFDDRIIIVSYATDMPADFVQESHEHKTN